MKAFIFDTETTWLPARDETLDKQPYTIQFAGVLWEITKEEWFKEIERVNQLIKPNILIPFASSQVHWIYDKDVKDSPSFLDIVDDKILKYLNTADMIVWHNVSFDENMINIDLERVWRKWDYSPANVICTMKSSTEFCKLRGRWLSFKPPRLNELHKHLFGSFFDWAHDAMVDVEATVKCFEALVMKWVIEIKEKQTLTLF